MLCYTADIRCDNLTSPADGMMSCSYDRDGVGYERDTCTITCNTGYVLTGNVMRTCQSNGSWSGINAICRRGTVCTYVYDSYVLQLAHLYVQKLRIINIIKIYSFSYCICLIIVLVNGTTLYK